MKILSVIFFLVTMVWTWTLIHSTPRVSFETHVGIHDNLALYIAQALEAKKPNARDFEIQRLWTEETKPDGAELRAHFTYSFSESDNKTRTTIQGWAILEPLPVEEGAEPGTRWLVKEVHPISDSVVFEEGSIIRANEDPEMEVAPDAEGSGTEAPPDAEQMTEPQAAPESGSH